jgi:hypothetical protein
MTKTKELSPKKTDNQNSEISDEKYNEYVEIAKELAIKHKIPKVHIYVGIHPVTGEHIVGYLKDPNFAHQLYFMGQITKTDIYAASDGLASALILKEESNPLTYGDDFECNPFKLGIIHVVMTMGEVIQNSFKKK